MKTLYSHVLCLPAASCSSADCWGPAGHPRGPAMCVWELAIFFFFFGVPRVGEKESANGRTMH